MIKWYAFLPRNIRKRIKTRKLIKAPLFTRWTDFMWDNAKLVLFRRQQIREKTGPIVQNMILGPCNARCGWVETKEDINCGVGAQDLYYSYQIYKKYYENFPNLKNIIIFYCPFSQGLDSEYTGHFTSMIAHHVFMGIPYHNEDRALSVDFKSFERILQKDYFKIEKAISDYSNEYIGFTRDNILSEEFIKNVALGHMKNNKRTDRENIYLISLINEAKKNNQNVWVVIPPFMFSYRKYLPEEKSIFSNLYLIEKKYSNVKVLNYFDARNFDETKDFTDYEHLNKQGAEKLTKEIKKCLKF